jgi:hypothetical protein
VKTVRPWNMREVALLRRHYGPASPAPLPLREVARLLGRPAGGVSATAGRLGLAPYAQPWGRPWTPRCDRALRRMNVAGLSDADIARKLGRGAWSVRRRRRALGVPRVPAAVTSAANHRRACVLHGVRSIREVQTRRLRVACLLRGWPAADTPRECDVLDLIAASPGVTSVEVTRALGYKHHGVQGNGGCVLRRLEGRGLITRASRPGVRGGLSLCWSLAPGVAKGCGELPPDRHRDGPKTAGIRVCGTRHRAS